MKLRLALLFLGSLPGALLFTGCKTASVSTPVPSPYALSEAVNTEWLLVRWISVDGALNPPDEKAPITLQIGEMGRVSGSAGINRYFGNVLIALGALNWNDALASSRIAGPPALMEREQRYMADLRATRKISQDSTRLIFTGEGSLLLEFANTTPDIRE